MDILLGTILLWPMNRVPIGFALCNGQQISISQNPALYSLLGTTYGGNGTTYFNLPDLRGRVPVGAGQVSGSSWIYALGQSNGHETIPITPNNMPAHAHGLSSVSGTVSVSTGAGTGSVAQVNDYLGAPQLSGEGVNLYTADATNSVAVKGVSLSGNTDSFGSGAPIDVRQPYTVVNYIIAIEGIYPSFE